MNFGDPFRILHSTAEALAIFDVEVENHQTPLGADPGPQHADAIGLVRGNGVGLLQQQGARRELGCRPEPHQDVGIERGIVEGLLLVAEAAAQHLHKPVALLS